MQPRPFFDRSLWIPIVISVVSILGLGWILSTRILGKPPIPPTATPYIFSSLEARTLTPSPSATPTTSTGSAQGQDEPLSTPTGTSPDAYPGPLVETSLSTSTLTPESLPTASATLTPYRFQLLPAGKYDDTDPNIAYDQSWIALKNPSTASSYKGTIHASNSIGNAADFRFSGERFRLGYKRGKSFGTVTVLIDGQPYSFHEQDFGLVWRSPQLSPGEHVVRIIHESGEAINLDYIEILD